MSRNFQSTQMFRDDPGHQVDLVAMYRAMRRAELCICDWDLGPMRIPNLRCPVHALEDAAAEAVGRIMGGE